MDRTLYIKLEEWNNLNEWTLNVKDAIENLAGQRNRNFSWAILSLVEELVDLAGRRALALEELKPFGIKSTEDAFMMSCKVLSGAVRQSEEGGADQ